MSSIPNIKPSLLPLPEETNSSPRQVVHFGNGNSKKADHFEANPVKSSKEAASAKDASSKTETADKADKKEAEGSSVKKGDFIQGSFSGGVKRMLGMAFLRPTGWVETAIDIAAMVGFGSFIPIPPPFAIKHFLEGLVGANTLVMKGERQGCTTWPWANNKKFYAEDYGNRTLVSAIWNGVFKVFGKKPSDFDIAKAKEMAAAG